MVSRDQRLRKRADFNSARARARSSGVRVSDRLFALTVARPDATPCVNPDATPDATPDAIPDSGQTRWGLAVSRRVGNAVVRNRVKRRIRESIRNMDCVAGMDVIVSARPAAADADSATIRSSLQKLAGRAGLTPPAAKTSNSERG